jgi:hypothetical protein
MSTSRSTISRSCPLLLALTLAGCEPQQPQPTGEAQPDGTVGRLTQEMDRAIDRADDIAREQGSRFIDEAQLRLRQMRDRLANAEMREDLSEEGRSRFRAAAAKLREDIRNLETRLEELRGRGAGAWREAAPQFREAMNELGESFETFRRSYLRRDDAPAEPVPPPPP